MKKWMDELCGGKTVDGVYHQMISELARLTQPSADRGDEFISWEPEELGDLTSWYIDSPSWWYMQQYNKRSYG